MKKIMEDHGGRLLLDDRTDGPGAVATLVLPLSGPSAARRPGARAGDALATVAGKLPTRLTTPKGAGWRMTS